MKVYLTRAQTRAMSWDHPIGDPFGGPAYGERRDPVSAVVAVSSMGATYAAAGSLAAMTLTQGLVFAGGALSLAGNLTGNKKLSKLGSIVGIAGGVGMLGEAITGQTLAEGFKVGNLTGGATSAAESATAPLAESVAQAPAAKEMASMAATDTAGQAARAMSTAAPSAAAPTTAASTAAPAVNSPQGLLRSALQFTKDNPMAAYVGGQLVSGVGNYLGTQDERDYADKLRRERAARLNAGYQQVDTGVNVNPSNVNIQMPGLLRRA